MLIAFIRIMRTQMNRKYRSLWIIDVLAEADEALSYVCSVSDLACTQRALSGRGCPC